MAFFIENFFLIFSISFEARSSSFLNKKSSLCSGEIFFLLFTHINYQFLFVKNLTFFFAKFTIIIVWATQILFNLFKVLCYSMFFLILAWLLHRSNEGAFKFDICSLDMHNHIYALVIANFFFFYSFEVFTKSNA